MPILTTSGGVTVRVDSVLKVGSVVVPSNTTAGDLSATRVFATTVDAATGFSIAGGATLANVLRGNGTNFVSATLGFSDLSGSITTAQIPDRTRRLPLAIVTPAISTDAHGSFGADAHTHAADAADTNLLCYGVTLPSDDAAAAWVIKVAWSTSVGANNVFLGILARNYRSADTAPAVKDVAAAAIAAPAGANTITVTTFTLPSAWSGNLGSIQIGLNCNRTSVSDTNTGQLSVWAIWAEYTADS